MAFTKHPLLDFEFLPTKLEKYCIYFLTGCHLIRTKNCTNVGLCVVFLVHGTILQQWRRITAEEFCQHRKKKKPCLWLLKNRANHCWRIVPVTVEQSCQWPLKNYTSNYWRIVPVTWRIMSVTVGKIVSVTVDESCQRLLNSRANCFFLFLTLAKSLPVFRVNSSIIIDYFNSGSQLSKLQDYWLIIIFIFLLYTFYQPL